MATRPVSANGLGWTVALTFLAFEGFRSRFPVLEETAEVVDLWLDLVVSHELKGKRIQDAHLLATHLLPLTTPIFRLGPA